MKDIWSLMGVSRGLGRAFVDEVMKRPNVELHLWSRKIELLSSLKSPNVYLYQSDFSKPEDQAQVLKSLSLAPPHRLFYFAAGGPYGTFHEKKIHAHQWALEVSFLFPLRLIHELCTVNVTKQAVFMGSAIAENAPDPLAASYSASKHALKGLVYSVRQEKPDLDLRLFSPGYMDTGMLPDHSKPRQQGIKLLDPKLIASDLLSWALDDQAPFHKLIKNGL